MEFKHIYLCEPIDDLEKAELADDIIVEAVRKQLPEGLKDGRVYKLVVPIPPKLEEIYICNDGPTYIFSNFDLIDYATDLIDLIEY